MTSTETGWLVRRPAFCAAYACGPWFPAPRTCSRLRSCGMRERSTAPDGWHHLTRERPIAHARCGHRCPIPGGPGPGPGYIRYALAEDRGQISDPVGLSYDRARFRPPPCAFFYSFSPTWSLMRFLWLHSHRFWSSLRWCRSTPRAVHARHHPGTLRPMRVRVGCRGWGRGGRKD